MNAKTLKQNRTHNNNVDEYTAKMDRLVKGLKKQSEKERIHQKKIMLMWIGIGFLIVVVSIALMLTSGMSDFGISFLQ